MKIQSLKEHRPNIREDILQLLVEEKADPNLRNNDGRMLRIRKKKLPQNDPSLKFVSIFFRYSFRSRVEIWILSSSEEMYPGGDDHA